MSIHTQIAATAQVESNIAACKNFQQVEGVRTLIETRVITGHLNPEDAFRLHTLADAKADAIRAAHVAASEARQREHRALLDDEQQDGRITYTLLDAE